MKLHAVAIAAALCAALGVARAQTGDPLRDAVAKAVASNPEVAARFHALKAADEAVTIGRAGYLPRLDLEAIAGRDRDRIDTRTPQNQTLGKTGVTLTLSQVLWDGMATRHEIGRLGHERLARYFELIDTTEQVALEATKAYYDVLRFRRLVALAEENYVQHRASFLQIQSRVQAGVGRGVDLEQAAARLALAQSNLTTEQANLHDVSARFQRLVGEAPGSEITGAARLRMNLSASADVAARDAITGNAAISAAIESLRAARAASTVRQSAFQPRVEARLRAGGGQNYEAVQDRSRAATGEIVLNWNLYNGGADQARVRQQTSLLAQAADLRDKACRDVRQTAQIAFNDTRRLVEQIRLLERNTQAIERARDAYRQQFDIGQRSLLDVLNAENELYTARRSLANAQSDLDTAFARSHAASGRLTTELGIARRDSGETVPWSAADDGPGRCASEIITVSTTPISSLDARAQRMAETVPVPAATTGGERPANRP